MRCSVIMLIVEFILYNNGGCGLQLPWGIRKSRKLLLDGGEPVTDQAKSMVTIHSDKGVMTGVVLQKHLIALPGVVGNPKVGNTALERKSSNGGWTFWTYEDAKEPIAEYYTGHAAPTGDCHVFGTDRKQQSFVFVPAEIDTYTEKQIVLKTPKFCEVDRGAALICEKKLVGIVSGGLKGNHSTKQLYIRRKRQDETTLAPPPASPSVSPPPLASPSPSASMSRSPPPPSSSSSSSSSKEIEEKPASDNSGCNSEYTIINIHELVKLSGGAVSIFYTHQSIIMLVVAIVVGGLMEPF